jgi:uncharacterized protein YsxB (DUF464 family)
MQMVVIRVQVGSLRGLQPSPAHKGRTMTDTLIAALRKALAEFDPEWVEEAIARAGALPDADDPDAVCAAVTAALQARLDTMSTYTEAMRRQNDEMERSCLARDAAYELAMTSFADHNALTIH